MTHAPDEMTSVQNVRARGALRRIVDDLLRGSGLEIRELAHHLVISNPTEPRDPDKGRIYINYTTGEVSHRLTTWNYFGPLQGYEPNDDPDREPAVDATKIIATLTGQAPPPAL
jgi:hypothetical protein